MLLQILFFVAIFALLGILVRQAREQYSPVIAFAVLIVCLPLNESFRIWSMAVMMLLVIVAFILNKSRQFTWQPIFYVIAGIYPLNFLGLIQSGCFSLANKNIEVSIPLIAAPILFSMVQLSRRNVMLLLRFFVWIVIAVCIYGLLSYAIAVYDFSWQMAFLYGKRYAPFFTAGPIMWHPSALNLVLLMALPVSLYLRYHDGKQITRVEMLLAIVLPILVAFMIGARVGVAVFPVLLALGYLFYCKFKPMLKWSLAVVTTVTMIVTLFLLPADIRERYTDQLRVDQRNIAISAIQEKPILGWGTWTQHELMSCQERRERVGVKTSCVFNHFHNVYLDMMVQFGLIGILVLLLLICWVFKISIQKKHFLLLSFMAMYALAFWFDNVIQSQRFVTPFVFWFCFLIVNQKYLVERKTQ